MDLITKRIYEIADVVGGGTPSTSNEEYWGGDIPWLSPADLTGYQSVYISHGEKFITPEGVKKSGTQRLPAGSVLFSSRAPIGYIAIAQNEIYTNQGFKSLVCKSEVINNLYLYYYLKLNLNYIKNFASGATFPELSANRIKNIKITFCKSLHEQQKIASILSAYDSQIENNQKRIKLLEQMAENLYKEWFVRFRFPGYENAEFEGGVPKGWKIEKLGNVANICTGKCNREDAEEDGIYPLFDRSQEIKKSNSWLMDCKAIIVPGEGTSFIPRYYEGKFNLHQRCYCVEPIQKGTGKYLFYMLMFNRAYFLSVATGATVPSLRLNNFTKMKFIMPSFDLCIKYDKQISMFFNEINALTREVELLTHQRDLLLPRLMSGKLSI